MKEGKRKATSKRVRPKGIFCLESDWWGQITRKTSVEPILGLLGQWAPYHVPYVHRDVATRAEFEYDIKKWTQRGADKYPILYLALHGSPGHVYFGDHRRAENVVTITQLGEMLAGKCNKRIIHFGSCDTLDVHGGSINAFLRKSGALAVCGYRGDVDWLESAAFELIVFSGLQGWTLTIPGAKAMRNDIKRMAPSLCKRLSFHMAVRSR